MCEDRQQRGRTKKEEESGLSAVILAGGLGTRLRAMVSDRPKVMAMVADRPFVEWILIALQAAGIRHVVFCIGYLGDMIRDYFQDGTAWGMTIEYSCEQELLGTGGALRQCLSYVHSDPVLVLNGDSFCQVDLGAYLTWYREQDRAGALVLTKVSNPDRFGTVDLAQDGCIMNFREKSHTYTSSWINAGIYLFSRRFIEAIPTHQQVSLEQNILPFWTGRNLWGFPCVADFVDLGTPEGLLETEELLSSLSHTV